jgi:hypothetical protein
MHASTVAYASRMKWLLVAALIALAIVIARRASRQ